ncbi:protein SON-like [Raphanus sativus]|nr:protein SON-like [Raphanus sativus]
MSRSQGQGPRLQSLSPTYFEPFSRTPKQRCKTPEPALEFPKLTHIPQILDSTALQTPRVAETRPRTWEQGREYMKVGKRLQSKKEGHLSTRKDLPNVFGDGSNIITGFTLRRTMKSVLHRPSQSPSKQEDTDESQAQRSPA